jgi:Uma2 family endonuclease
VQQRLDDYLAFGVRELWVIDPRKHRGRNVTANGWSVAQDAIMRTSDGVVAVPLDDVLLPLS